MRAVSQSVDHRMREALSKGQLVNLAEDAVWVPEEVGLENSPRLASCDATRRQGAPAPSWQGSHGTTLGRVGRPSQGKEVRSGMI